tara:strand:+ start:654 stop:1019 length:366 start_codon:yes stop_codon:yes gene_type:complete
MLKKKNIEKKESVKRKVKKLSQSEYEKRILDLAKKGLTSEKIGESLKKEGIQTKDFEKKISKILKEKNLYQSPDLKNLEEKLERVKKHYEKNKQDKRSLRERERIFAEIRKLKKYLKIPVK